MKCFYFDDAMSFMMQWLRGKYVGEYDPKLYFKYNSNVNNYFESTSELYEFLIERDDYFSDMSFFTDVGRRRFFEF